MSTADPLIVLPEGTFPLEFADSARDTLRGTKRPHDDVVALKCEWAPHLAARERILVRGADTRRIQARKCDHGNTRRARARAIWRDGRACALFRHACESRLSGS